MTLKCKQTVLSKVRPYIGLHPCELQLSTFNSYRMAAHNVISRYATRRVHTREFGKKRYLFRIVYGGEHFCRVSELCDLNSLQECKMKRNLKVAPFFTLVARGGPVVRISA